MKKYSLLLSAACFSICAVARENSGVVTPTHPVQTLAVNCAPGMASVDLDISNVRARLLQSGNMWYDPTNTIPNYEVPKNSGKNSMYAGALWFGGVDAGGQIKVATQTYWQTGTDFWPGPLDTTSASITAGQCLYYDQFWKVSKQNVIDFVNTGVATPEILTWPGNGNASFNETHFLAPFFDNNGDGIYNTNDGDYPYFDLTGASGNCNEVLHGDQSIWWVFNDEGNVHASGTGPIGLEIQAQAFAFVTTSEAINNTTFYRYKIINRSSAALNQTYFGQWIDPDLGFFNDDYVGCDVNRGMGYCYNGDSIDDLPDGYGANPPAIGVDFLEGPLADPGDGIDNDRDGTIDEAGEQIIMSKFICYDNNNNPVNGNPVGFQGCLNYLHGHWQNGPPMTYGGNGSSGGTNYCDFMFPDDTDTSYFSTLGAWSEVTEANTGGDRRFVQSAGPFTLQPGSVNYITVAVIWARDTLAGASLDSLKAADNIIQQLYDSCFMLAAFTSVNELDINDNLNVTISPNPFSDQTLIDFNYSAKDEFSFVLYDVQGKKVREIKNIKSGKLVLRKENLGSGVYFFKLENNKDKSGSGQLIVE